MLKRFWASFSRSFAWGSSRTGLCWGCLFGNNATDSRLHLNFSTQVPVQHEYQITPGRICQRCPMKIVKETVRVVRKHGIGNVPHTGTGYNE